MQPTLMRYLHKSCVLDNIDKVFFLRLCSIIGRTFVDDLRKLKDYINENDEYSVIANNFINLGLMDNLLEVFGRTSQLINLMKSEKCMKY